MRWMIAALALFLQTVPLPPAYPRPGATKLFDNSRVQVWDIAWLKQQYPLHRHAYDLVGVYYSPGDRIIVSTSGERRPVSTPAWGIAFQKAGVTHVEEGASDMPLRAVFVELKEAQPQGQADTAVAPPAFPGPDAKQVLDNERTTVWEFVPAPKDTGTPHRHLRDAVAVSFEGLTPHVTFIPRGTVHNGDIAVPADRAYLFELK